MKYQTISMGDLVRYGADNYLSEAPIPAGAAETELSGNPPQDFMTPLGSSQILMSDNRSHRKYRSQFSCDAVRAACYRLVPVTGGLVSAFRAFDTIMGIADDMGLFKPCDNYTAFHSVSFQDRQGTRYAWLEMLALYLDELGLEVEIVADSQG